jgi:hypothetical protein
MIPFNILKSGTKWFGGIIGSAAKDIKAAKDSKGGS